MTRAIDKDAEEGRRLLRMPEWNTIWEKVGDVTKEFAAVTKSERIKAVLRDLDVKIERHMVPAPRSSLDGFISIPGDKGIGRFRVILDGKVVLQEGEMPRDVFNFLSGIAAGRVIDG